MSLKTLVADALAATETVDDRSVEVAMASDEAALKLLTLQRYLDDAPRTAVEIVDRCGPDMFHVQVQVSEFAELAMRRNNDFDRYIQRDVAHSFARVFAEKAPAKLVHVENSFNTFQSTAVYQASAYVLTREQLEKFAKDAFLAGLASS